MCLIKDYKNLRNLKDYIYNCFYWKIFSVNKSLYQFTPPTYSVERCRDSVRFQENVSACKKPDRISGTSTNKTEKYVITVKSWNKIQSSIIKEKKTNDNGYSCRPPLIVIWYLLVSTLNVTPVPEYTQLTVVIVSRYIMRLCVTLMWTVPREKSQLNMILLVYCRLFSNLVL